MRLEIMWYLLQMMVMLVIGFSLHAWLYPLPSYAPAPTAEHAVPTFQSGDCSVIKYSLLPCRYQMDVEKTVLVRFTSKERFANETAAAYTYPYGDPCTIVFPTGMEIAYDPMSGESSWGYKMVEGLSAADIVAHEFLHCFLGAWHPSDAWVGMAKVRANMKRWRESERIRFTYRFPYLHEQSYEKMRPQQSIMIDVRLGGKSG